MECAELRFETPEELLTQRIEFVGKLHEEQSITPVKFVVVSNTNLKVSVKHLGLPDGGEVLWMATRVENDDDVYGDHREGAGRGWGNVFTVAEERGAPLFVTSRFGDVHKQPAGEYEAT